MEPENSMRKRQKFSDYVDRISHLPEALLTYILSLLPTIKAVATKFLSKSWSHHWTELTSFDFDDEDWPGDSWPESVPENMSFQQFINMVLNGAKIVHNLRLRWQDDTSYLRSDYLSQWISMAVARGVKVLDLSTPTMYGAFRFLLPGELYNCATLESLRLEGSILVKIPIVVSLPQLTALELYRVTFDSDESISNLVSGCRILESLTIETEHREENNDEEVFTICSPTLKRLRICKHSRSSNFELRVDAPALEFFGLRDYESSSVSVQELKSVKEVDIDVNCLSSDMLIELLETFHGVRLLKLSERTVDTLSYGDRLPGILEEVTKLAVQVEICQWSFLVYLIRGCRKLEFLDVECVLRCSESCYGGDPSYVPECFSSSLKEVILIGSDCIHEEVKMLLFILKHGSCLKKVSLCSPQLFCSEIWDCTVNAVERQSRPDCELCFGVNFF